MDCTCFDSSDLYHLAGDPVRESDGYRMHSSFSQQLLKDHIDSSQQPEHSLIQVSHWQKVHFSIHIYISGAFKSAEKLSVPPHLQMFSS